VRRPDTGVPGTKRIADVSVYYANIIDYVRFVLLVAALFAGAAHYLAAAVLYFTSQGLDYFDGKVARYLKQTSKFGILLDYTVDEVTQAAFFMLIVTCDHRYLWPFAIYMSVEFFSCSHAVYHSAAGHWKDDDGAGPVILRPFMRNGDYTLFGDIVIHAHHGFVSMCFIRCFSTSAAVTWAWALLMPFSVLNFIHIVGIVQNCLRRWRE
jgi:phosphatidylglycerophosphate synthase